MFYPEKADFIELGQKCKRVPVCLEIEGDMVTPIGLFRRLCSQGPTYLLESVEGGEKWGRYSYIGRNPFAMITAHGNQVTVDRRGDTEVRTGDPLRIINELMEDYRVASFPFLPDFCGGAVGYFGYDTIRSFERLPEANPDELGMPDIHLMLTDEVVVYDHLKQKVRLIVVTETTHDPAGAYEGALTRLCSLREEIESGQETTQEPEGAGVSTQYRSSETEESYQEKVVRAKQYIHDGDILQVVLSQRLSVPTEASPFATYRVLRSLNPSPYLFFIDFGDYQLVGSSPELLVKVKGDHVETCPIAGTRPRGKSDAEDEALAQELLADQKEQAEHLMLVDLGRNDLGKICQFGTVETQNLMHVEKYSHVMHIVTNVQGRLRPECSHYDALQACLPAGTVSGAPKVRAMEIIDELEIVKRGVYAGAVGYLAFNGNMDVCISIRTIVFKDQTAHVQAGAGIVADSHPDREYQETLRKAEALVEAIRRAEMR